MYGVSGRTVQRWLVDLRDNVRVSTLQRLQARVAVSPSELDSLLGLVDSQLQLSLHRVLGASPKP
jgi:RNA polymerase sigma-70 factor (ECF subfamily)